VPPVSVLTIKVVRDLWRDRWQYLAVGAMVLLGVTFFDAAYMAYKNLDASYTYTYARMRFEEFGVAFHAAPDRVVSRIQRIPGVTAVEGRLVEDVVIELPGRATKKLIGRLISVPADRRPAINDLQVVDGRYLSSRTAREILLEASFARYHNLRPGDVVDAIRGGSRARFRVAGIVRSPEYLFVVRSKQDIMPFPQTFGVMFVSGEVLKPLVGRTGLINEVRVTIADSTQRAAIMREARRLLAAYQPEDPVAREDQPSYQLLDQDLEGFKSYAVLFPALFLSVAGLTTYTLLTRLVHTQRPIIGVLRAMGHGQAEVVTHYLIAAAFVGALGSLLGSAAGYALAGVTTTWYTSFLQAPYVVIQPWWTTLAGGFVLGTGVCVAGGVLPARIAAAVRPVEALREAAAPAARIVALDRLLPGLGRLPLLWRLPLRNLFRQPRRAFSTLFGVAAAISLIMVGQGLLDSVDAVMEQFIGDVIRDDVRVEFMGFQDRNLVNRAQSWPGVVSAEGTLEVPVEMAKDGRTFSALLVGLEPGTRLQQLQDEDGRAIDLTDAGLILGQVIRQKLQVQIGDVLQISLPRSRVQQHPTVKLVRVAGFVWQPIGTIAYLPADRARRLFREDLWLPPGTITGIRVKVDPQYLAQTKERLLDLPGAGAVLVLPEIRRMFEELMALSRRIISIMLLFGLTLAFAITFNTATINVMERTNEVATMRTIGIGRWPIFRLIGVENLMMAVLGVAIGLPAGHMLVIVFLRAAQTEEQMEVFAMQAVIRPATYVLAAVATVAAMMLSQIPALIQVGRLNLARATKERVG
jgi:putative ABC transport system permease protein